MPNQLWIDANDIGYNYLKPNAFRMVFHNIPKVSYFCQSVTIPGVQLGETKQANKFYDVPVVGDKLTYDSSSIRFIIDDQMKNWLELMGWIEGIGFPDSHEQFNALRRSGTQKTLAPKLTKLNEESGIYSDATLTVLTAKNNPFMQISFEDMFPISVSSIEFDAAISGIEYATATAVFSFKNYTVTVL